jgi:hypothetical protein
MEITFCLRHADSPAGESGQMFRLSLYYPVSHLQDMFLQEILSKDLEPKTVLYQLCTRSGGLSEDASSRAYGLITILYSPSGISIP